MDFIEGRGEWCVMTFAMAFFFSLFCAGEEPPISYLQHGIFRVVGLNSSSSSSSRLHTFSPTKHP